MKKLLLSTLSALAIVATAQVDANYASADVSGEAAIREDMKVNTNHITGTNKPCTWTQGPTFVAPEVVVPAKTFQCPSCPVCPKVRCQAELIEECSTCMKAAPRAHHGCKGGSCKRRHNREVVETVVAE